jgi:hypothetical protein
VLLRLMLRTITGHEGTVHGDTHVVIGYPSADGQKRLL